MDRRFSVFLAALVLACSSSSENPAERACTPGATQHCASVACPNGTQKCESSGQAWSECLCGTGGMAGSSSGGASGSAAGGVAGVSTNGGTPGTAGMGGSAPGGAGGAAGASCPTGECQQAAICCDGKYGSGRDALHDAICLGPCAGSGCCGDCTTFCINVGDTTAMLGCFGCLGAAGLTCESQCADYRSCLGGCGP